MRDLIECDVYGYEERYGDGYYFVPSGTDITKLDLYKLGSKIGTYVFDKLYLNDIMFITTKNGITYWDNVWTE